jgi:predicted RNase H-like nuclease (RuvC/YqgF family)
LWFCNKCKGAVKKNNEKIKELEAKNKEMEDKLKDMDEKWEKFKEEIMNETAERVRKELNHDLVKQTMECVMYQLKEDEEKNKRKANLVIYNLEESDKSEIEERTTDDLEGVKYVVGNSMGVPARDYRIKELIRMGKITEGRNRPLLIKFADEKEKWHVLKYANNLKEKERLAYH